MTYILSIILITLGMGGVANATAEKGTVDDFLVPGVVALVGTIFLVSTFVFDILG